mmetsp:Transcript_1489/g.3085  ORF Transcript_1489/g.3085 Transcript_1489/m.3085 type:complete len:115 (+) Transcript_1489:56-400(+)
MLSRALRQTATSSIAKRAFSTAPLEFSLPPLGFEFGALEPYISEEIMTIHYTKHHQTYINNLNVALKSYAEAEAKKGYCQDDFPRGCNQVQRRWERQPHFVLGEPCTKRNWRRR